MNQLTLDFFTKYNPAGAVGLKQGFDDAEESARALAKATTTTATSFSQLKSAISSAIADLNSTGGGLLRFPAGTYLLTTQYGTGKYLRPITVPCRVVGAGRQNTTVMANGSYADDVFSFGTSGSPVSTGSTIENIGISTQGTNTNALISVYGASNNENVNMVFRSLYLGPGSGIPGKWFSGGNYAVGTIIYDSSVSAYYYCTSAVSGSTPPHSDGSHWATSTYSIINNPVYGIKTYQTCNNILDGSVIQNCQYNLYWSSDSTGSDQDLEWGSITGNAIEGGVYGIYHIDDHGEFVNGNIFYGNCYSYYSTVTNPVSNNGNSDTKITGNWIDRWGPGAAYNSSVSGLNGAAISFNLATSGGASYTPGLTNICITGNSLSSLNQNGFGGNGIEVFGGWNNGNHTGASFWTITGNQIQFGEEANANGIYLSKCSYMAIESNELYQANSTTGNGIYIDSGCFEINPSETNSYYQNSGPGVYWTVNTIASASTISVPYNARVVLLTGSTSISQINLAGNYGGGSVSPYQGQKLILMNQYGGSSISLTGGGNIAANATIGAGQCCQLVSDGTRWYSSI